MAAMDVVEVSQATEVDVDLVAAFDRLVPQLSRSSPPPTADELAEIITDPATTIFVAKLDDVIVGSLTLVLFRIPTGVRAFIEDVVTDEAGRGKGVGSALTRAALDHAKSHGAKTVDLTSRPSREAANRLYQHLGFQLRETNVYRFAIETDEPESS